MWRDPWEWADEADEVIVNNLVPGSPRGYCVLHTRRGSSGTHLGNQSDRRQQGGSGMSVDTAKCAQAMAKIGRDGIRPPMISPEQNPL